MTYEEALKTMKYINNNMAMEFCNRGLLGGIEKSIEALEKQIPKKPRETRCALMCPSCNHKITEKGCKKLYRNYCKKCGQAIDWGDSK